MPPPSCLSRPQELRPCSQVPLLVGTTVFKGLQGWRHKRRLKRKATESSLLQPRREVVLEWDNLQCTLRDKQGKERQLLQEMQGCAKPGRCVEGRCLLGLPARHSNSALLGRLAWSPGPAPTHDRGTVDLYGCPK